MIDLTVVPIEKAVAQQLQVANHYLHRKAPCSYAYGLMREGVLVGVVLYGKPASPPLCVGVCGPEESSNVIELTRLWIDDSVGKNGESFLIGNSLRLMPKEIVVSFADTAQDHVGVVYQATNWFYTGLSAKRNEWHVEGVDVHCKTLSGRYNKAELQEKYGDRFSLVPRSRKHRYVFFNCGKIRRKQLLKKLRYPILPYPKREAVSQ